jgi:hypothetical protein
MADLAEQRSPSSPSHAELPDRRAVDFPARACFVRRRRVLWCLRTVKFLHRRDSQFLRVARTNFPRSALIPNRVVDLVVCRRVIKHVIPGLIPTLPARSKNDLVVVPRVIKKSKESGEDEANSVVFTKCATKAQTSCATQVQLVRIIQSRKRSSSN